MHFLSRSAILNGVPLKIPENLAQTSSEAKIKMKTVDSSQNAISKALRMLSLLAQSHDPLRLGDIADATGMPKSSVHRILTILADESYIEPTGDGFYQPGNGLRVLAAGMEGHSGSGIEATLTGLQRSTQHAVFLAVLSGEAVVYTHKVDPKLSYSIAPDVGSQLPLFTSAAGKAMLAFLPDDERDHLIGDAATRDLADDLARVRDAGFAIDHGGADPSLCSVAAAVLDNNGYPVAAVCVSSLVFVLDPAELAAMGRPVIDAADEISRRL
ncbi:IclR family transcriptional regulator [Cryobacterium lactosi]|uniref:IclR family transcriptional regulator n=1 Tax=Cryobacterium lactosi TaxID=1259202 RepID=A0A4R9BZ14_9MICO|nr:IclR family transcriptional regulator [Cryobacterium lactosi]TFD95157.1 IclR family transcriptional regulator [Cryobacterium lactosi]